METENKTLLVGGVNNEPEIFYTIEGEGRYIGYPSVFMRLSMCTLTCIGFKSPDAPYGCDSYVSWSKKNKMTFEEIAKFFEAKGFDEYLRKGAILKLTGGEPFIQQVKLIEFVKFVRDRWKFTDWSQTVNTQTSHSNLKTLHIDFETNATIMPLPEWQSIGCKVTYTTSPKLSNNGDPFEKRFKPDVLRFLIANNACFKFVARNEADLDELYEFFINNPAVDLPTNLIWIMPMCGSRNELVSIGESVADICKKHGFKFSNRMHLQLWDKALRV
jgi:organic radical activating enzyme